jgi:hypothetical protein
MPLHVAVICIGVNGVLAALFALAGLNSLGQLGLGPGAVQHFAIAATLGYTAFTMNKLRAYFSRR